MAVSYKKLWVTLAEKEMSRAELRKKAEIAPNTMTKLSRNEYVAMPILDKLCKTLGTDYGDIMEYVPENEKQMQSKTGDECAYEIPNLVRYNCKGSTCTDKFIIVLERECLYGFI